LRTWKPAPPKLKKPAEEEVPPETAVAEPVGVEPEDIAELPSETVERSSASVVAPDLPASNGDESA
jgi:hypothetical protein